jgi:hypothetical protein
MTEDKREDIERSLARLVPKPVPNGISQRVLNPAYEAGKKRILTRGWLIAAAVCAALLAAVFIADAFIARHESVRLAALLDQRSPARSIEDPTFTFMEILGIGADDDLAPLRLIMLASIRIRQYAPDRHEALKRLKGWLEHETPEDLY